MHCMSSRDLEDTDLDPGTLNLEFCAPIAMSIFLGLLRKRNFIPSGTRLQVQPQLMGKAKIRSYLGETVSLVERGWA